jgi:hypothetical protein
MTITCSTDGTIKVAEACIEPEVMCSFEYKSCQLTGLDFSGSCLAVASSGTSKLYGPGSNSASLWLYTASSDGM